MRKIIILLLGLLLWTSIHGAAQAGFKIGDGTPPTPAANPDGDPNKIHSRKENSRTALDLFKKLCIDMNGDFDSVAAWADGNLAKEAGWSQSNTMRGWEIIGRDLKMSLRIMQGSKRFCMLSGGNVDANEVHDHFARMQEDYAAQDGYSVSPNGFTGKDYDGVRPSDMPNGASYYNGAVFHDPDKPAGMDVVISTKNINTYTNLVIDVNLRDASAQP